MTQCHGIGHNVELTDIAPERVNAGNTRYGAENGPQHPVLERAQLHQVPVRALQGVLEDLTETGRDGPKVAAGPLGQLTLHGKNTLEDQLAGKVNVGPVLENHGDHRETELGERANLGGVRETRARLLDRVGHKLLDLERRQSRGL